jgi:uncharacterized protein (TIGR02246 family)
MKLIAALLLFAIGCAASAQDKSSSADEKEIAAVVDRFVEAWNRHDAHAFAGVFTENADFANVRGMGATGRDAIEKFHAPIFASIFKNSHQTTSVSKIRFLKPDIAAVDVRWEMTGATSSDGSARPLRKGLLNFIMTKSGGDWQIAVMHNTELTDVPSK